MSKNFFHQILTDVKVKVNELYDQNFTTKSFFGRPWPSSYHPRGIGSTMYRTGKLARSLRYRIDGHNIIISSHLPYANIHNEGGSITVTPQMKRFFWAMYRKTAGNTSKNNTPTPGQKKSHALLSQQAAFYKAMALKKAGSKIHIKQRQFIGDHPIISQAIAQIFDDNMKDVEKYIREILKPKK
ncbi:MAG: hypothetical protein N2747_00340 [Chitinophagaceae bacterium]|nr:hypothetical protein [Chitinophagaceae bacterium]